MKENGDIYKKVASEIFKVEEADVTESQRKSVKIILFPSIYRRLEQEASE